MNRAFVLRLALDFTAAGLLLAALAYWWLDNTAHELIGTGMFLLVLVHNVFNRRWYGRLSKEARQPRGLITIGLNATLVVIMLALLITSVMISRSVFGFLPIDPDRWVRELHLLAAYWAVVIVGIHVGLNWWIVMNMVRSGLGITGQNTVRTVVLRGVAICAAAFGLLSSFEMTLGSKLIGEITLDMWDFNSQTPRFFLNFASIMALYAVLAHYAMKLVRRAQPARANS